MADHEKTGAEISGIEMSSVNPRASGRTKNSVISTMERVFTGEEIVYVVQNMVECNYVMRMVMDLYHKNGATLKMSADGKKSIRPFEISWGPGHMVICAISHDPAQVLNGTKRRVIFDHAWNVYAPDRTVEQTWRKMAMRQDKEMESGNG